MLQSVLALSHLGEGNRETDKQEKFAKIHKALGRG